MNNYMNKLIIYGILILISFRCGSQTLYDVHKKYWYYRYRLKNNFLLIGDCQGCSLPVNQRSKNYINNDFDGADGFEGNMKWDDVTITLGWYLGVLATEYKLLSDYGEYLDSLKRELFHAFKPLTTWILNNYTK